MIHIMILIMVRRCIIPNQRMDFHGVYCLVSKKLLQIIQPFCILHFFYIGSQLLALLQASICVWAQNSQIFNILDIDHLTAITRHNICMYKVFELHHQKSTCLTVIYSSSKVYNLFLVTVSIIKSVSSFWLSTEISSWPKVILLFFSCDSIPSFTHLTVSLYKNLCSESYDS